MANKKKISIEEFRYYCAEFFRQRSDYYNLCNPETLTRLPNDEVDRECFYFMVNVGNEATRKILAYDYGSNSSRPFEVYEEWIDKNPLVLEQGTGNCAQLILIGEYKEIEEAFNYICTRGEFWRWSRYNMVYIDTPNWYDQGLKEDDPLVVRTKELLLPSFGHTLTYFVNTLNNHRAEILKGKYEVYTLGVGNFRQSYFTFNNR